MSKRKYTKFQSDTLDTNDAGQFATIDIDLESVESFEQEGKALIVHKDSGLWNRIIIQREDFVKILNELDQ